MKNKKRILDGILLIGILLIVIGIIKEKYGDDKIKEKTSLQNLRYQTNYNSKFFYHTYWQNRRNKFRGNIK